MYNNYYNSNYNSQNPMYYPYDLPQNSMYYSNYSEKPWMYHSSNSNRQSLAATNNAYINHFSAQTLPFNHFSLQNQLKKHDIEYLSTLYPYEISELKQLVANECDKMDYAGSMIYDECPDKVMFIKKCNDICELANCSCEYARKCNDKGFLKDLISVLLANEISSRRDNRRTFY